MTISSACQTEANNHAIDSIAKYDRVFDRAKKHFGGETLGQTELVISAPWRFCDLIGDSPSDYRALATVSTMIDLAVTHPDFRRGVSFRQSGEAAGRARHEAAESIHKQCQGAAAEVWARRPDLSKRQVAHIIAKDFDASAETIRKIIQQPV